MIARRHPDPAKAFRQGALLLCGVALTWTCAAFGLLVSQLVSGSGCPSRVGIASRRVHEVDTAIGQYQAVRGQCPTTANDLLDGNFISAWHLVDPWKRSIRFTCTGEDTHVTSAGPDGIFGTADDVMNER
jgi:hypothetical protein